MRRTRQLLLLLPACLALATASPAQASEHYTVRWGDTLTWIAEAHGMSLQRLAKVNGLDPYGVLVAGTVLRIPGHHHTVTHQSVLRTHGGHRITVQWGDTLSGIAARYGTTFTHLAEMNGLDPGGVLLAGSTLIVPGHATQTAAAPVASGGDFDAQRSIDRWSAHYGVNPHLARAVAWMESGYHTGVVSSVGAWGVMQIMPDTWRFVETLIGHSVPRTPDGNVRIGVAYLHHLLNEFGGSERLALAAYYQGPAGVRSYGILPASQLYIADVLALKARM
ncbi:MAG TPA: LysM peptidoglycan-binding domain-containing protein [Gaiellales bacterium]|nr:LysM peptidoglycan-binding domain-containing protein [Gaiellales bacterium]